MMPGSAVSVTAVPLVPGLYGLVLGQVQLTLGAAHHQRRLVGSGARLLARDLPCLKSPPEHYHANDHGHQYYQFDQTHLSVL
tara:strand:- start:827 stop:1072 length:246 start_codon:yes stop_codon:yes gene_type:complete